MLSVYHETFVFQCNSNTHWHHGASYEPTWQCRSSLIATDGLQNTTATRCQIYEAVKTEKMIIAMFALGQYANNEKPSGSLSGLSHRQHMSRA